MSASDPRSVDSSGGASRGDEPANVLVTPLAAADLMKLLPHRPPFFFLKSLREWSPGRRALAEVELDGSEDFFRGHFPGRPIVPGVILIEAAAQAAGLALASSLADVPRDGRLPSLAKVRAFRFRAAASPRQKLELEARVTSRFGDDGIVEVEIRRDGRAIAEGELVIALAS